MKQLLLSLILTLVASCGSVKQNKPSKEMEYSPVVSFSENSQQYVAKLGIPKGLKDKAPLVVIVHEWWGRNDYIESRARMLEAEGFTTLAVDLFGNGRVVETPSDAQALATPFYQNPSKGTDLLYKYVEAAKKDPHVDPTRVFVIGYCFGGTQALNFARMGADVAGVVSFHGGLESTIKPNVIKARVLAINGLADPMVPAKQRREFEKEMKAVGADFKVINYSGATHAFTNPRATEIGKKFKIPVAYDKKADEGSWKDLLNFLRK